MMHQSRRLVQAPHLLQFPRTAAHAAAPAWLYRLPGCGAPPSSAALIPMHR